MRRARNAEQGGRAQADQSFPELRNWRSEFAEAEADAAQLEGAGQRTRKEGSTQRRSLRNLRRTFLESLLSI